MHGMAAIQRAETLRLLAQVARQEASEVGATATPYDDLMQSADWLETKAMLLETGMAELPVT